MLSQSMKARLGRVVKNPFVWAFVVGIASLHLVKEMSLARRSAPPPLLSVGEWRLTDQDAKPFGSQELAGKVYVAHFFFTRCPTICPKLTQDMKALHRQFDKVRGQVHFVSFSVDPSFDTPEMLRAYRAKNEIAANDWSFLTGTPEELQQVVIKQMKLHFGDSEDDLMNISHVAEFVLFDQNGDMRGKFSTDPVGLAALERAAKLLIEKGANA